MTRALFKGASIAGWLAVLLAFAQRLYNLIAAFRSEPISSGDFLAT